VNASNLSPPDQRKRLLSISSLYGQGQLPQALFQLAVTACLWGVSYASGLYLMSQSWLAGCLVAGIAALFVVRLFMIQHDCGHRSFFRSRQANDALGFVLGIVTMTPYVCWRRFHATHHANSGHLDHRGLGDIQTLTTDEYAALTPEKQRMYRLYRHPLVLLVFGPPLLFILRQRTTYKVPAEWKAERRSVHQTNLGILAFGLLMCLWVDPLQLIAFHVLMMSVAAIVGVWLFYVQHQFPEAYWRAEGEWESWRASMEGATYYELPAVLRWLTANIGVHHIHHLDARIPSYRLYECFRRHPEFATPPRLGVLESFGCIRLKLWDTQHQRMVPFPRAEARVAALSMKA
jgi:acyl-lipid omega-6 desaturase (Delta-12 desaturase)